MTEKYETKIEKIGDLAYRMKFERTDSEMIAQAVEYLRDYVDLLLFIQVLSKDFNSLNKMTGVGDENA